MRVVFFRDSTSRVQGLAFFLLGLGSTLTILLLVLRASGLLLALAGWYYPSWAAWAVLAATLLLGLRGMQDAFGPARVRSFHLAKPGLHPGLEGLRIAQISDVHVSHMNTPGQVNRLVEQVLALKPDLIAVTGDLVDGPWEKLRQAVAPLAALKAPLGVHYITGNHEYYWGVDAWLREFKSLGFELLLNDHRVLEREGAKLLVLGVNDPTALRVGQGPGPDLETARRNAPEADYTLFLAHQPSAYALAETAGADLFLAGHTHGGQFFPFQFIVTFFHKHFRGLYQKTGHPTVYIHSGSGFWGPPNRLGVPPEIALFILERPSN
ncbi:MAG: metallophosphoesterase [bacterium]